MIGRAAELQDLLARVDAMCRRAHAQNVVFVTGEAGAGKTTLLRRVADVLGHREGPGAPLAVSTECSTPLLGQDVGQAEALEPWAELLADIVTDDAGPARKKEMAKLVTSVALAWSHCVPFVGGVLHSSIQTAMLMKKHQDEGKKEHAASQEQMFQQYVNFLAKASETRPLVLILDDFHWADTSSTNLLFSAARRLAGKRVLFMVAYRADDAASSRGGRGHPLLHVRNELGRYSLAADVVVPALSATDVKALLRARYSRYQDSDPFERWLVERSGGNALFITQYLATLEEDGIVGAQTGELKARFEAMRAPTSAFSVVEERIRRLDDDSRELLRYASVEGATFTVAVLASLTEATNLKLLARLRLLAEKHGVITSLGKDRIYASATTTYQFTNVLMQRALYESLEDEEREQLHTMIFASIHEDWEAAPDKQSCILRVAVRLAAHATTPEHQRLAAHMLLDAARASWARFADEETLSLIDTLERHLEALEAAHGADEREMGELRAGAHMVAGLVHKFRHRHDQAIERFRAARAAWDAIGNDKLALEAMMREAFTLENARRDGPGEQRSRETLLRAEKQGDDRVRSAMLNNLGLLAAAQGRHEEALDYQRRSLLVREQTGDRVGEAVSLGSMGLALFSAGQAEEALGYHRRSLALREELGDRVGQGYSLANIGNVLASLGRLDEALAFAGRSSAVREACGDVVRLADSLGNEAKLLLQLGRTEDAIERHAHALRLRETLGDARREAAALLDLGALLARSGQAARSRPLLERALRLARQVGADALAAEAEAQLATLPEVAEAAPETAPPPVEVAPAPSRPAAAASPAPAPTPAPADAIDGLHWLLRAALWLHDKVEDRFGS
jgi:tetratricopeptide (TPR) repeat protein